MYDVIIEYKFDYVVVAGQFCVARILSGILNA